MQSFTLRGEEKPKAIETLMYGKCYGLFNLLCQNVI